MQTLLLVVAGTLAGLVLVLGALWLWLKRKLTGLGDAIGALLGGMAVPPFRITLRPTSAPSFSAAKSIARSTASFESAGYRQVGDFEVPELRGVVVRGFWHPRQLSYAALYEHPQAGVVADAVALFRDRTMLTVSSTPETGLDRPERAPLLRLELDLEESGSAQCLHDRLVEASAGRRSIQTRPGEFARAFVCAYGLEQNWRIARGGVTAEEVRRAAAAGGQEAPDSAAVECVQAGWRSAIAGFVSEELRSVYLSAHPQTADRADRVRAVHEHSCASDLIDELAWAMVDGGYDEEDAEAEDSAHGAARRQLETLFAECDVREGFAAAQPLLPEKRRFERLASSSRPWAGDLYLAPPKSPEA